jgi:hypothetical protein
LNGNTARPSKGASGARTAKSSAPKWGQRNGHVANGHSNGAKAAGKTGSSLRSAGLSRNGSSSRPSGPRKDARPDARSSRNGSRKPALAAGAKAGNAKRYGFTARPKQETKKRG